MERRLDEPLTEHTLSLKSLLTVQQVFPLIVPLSPRNSRSRLRGAMEEGRTMSSHEASASNACGRPIPGLTQPILCRFRKNQSGATAVELGLIALPFFALLFAILETALGF